MQTVDIEKAQANGARRSTDALLYLFLTVGCVAALLAFLRPPALSDQLDYFSTAANLPDVSPTHRHLRLGLLIPVRAFIEAFGYSELAYYAMPVITGVALVTGTYTLGRQVANRWVGLSAAGLVVMNRYVITDATHLLPDYTAAAALTWGFVCLAAVGKRGLSVGARSNGMLIACGLLLGLAYLNREFIPIFFVLVPVAFLLYRIPWRGLIPIATSAAAMLAIEFVYGRVVYGDALVRLRASAGPRVTDRPFDTSPMEVVTVLPRELLSGPGGWIWIILLCLSFALPLLLGGVDKARRATAILVTAWSGGLWILLTVIGLLPSLVFGEDRVLLRLHKFRYWAPLLPAMLVGGLTAVDQLIRKVMGRYGVAGRVVGPALAACLAITAGILSMSSITRSGVWVGTGSNEFVSLREQLRQQPVQPLWLTEGTGRASTLVVPMYAREWHGGQFWKGDLVALNSAENWVPAEAIEEGLLLMYPFSMAWFTRASDPPPYLTEWPEDWSPVFIAERGQLALFRVGGSSSLEPIDDGGGRWQILEPTAEAEFDQDGVTLSVPSGERVRLVDDRAGGLASPSGEPTAESIAKGTLELTQDGAGSIRIICLFYDGTGARHPAPAVWYPNGSTESTDFACQRPPDLDRSTIRTHIDIRGPMIVSLKHGDSLAWWSHYQE